MFLREKLISKLVIKSLKSGTEISPVTGSFDLLPLASLTYTNAFPFICKKDLVQDSEKAGR